MGDADEVQLEAKLERGAPILSTWWRLALFWGVEAAVLGAFYAAYVTAVSRGGGFTVWIPVGWVLLALTTPLALRAEESRLARELRVARSGTALMRGSVLRRRTSAPWMFRFFATNLGVAAVLVAEGDRPGALDALAAGSPVMFGGMLPRLRRLIELDADRLAGSSAALERCAREVREMPAFGNLEADRYKTHVLVKALLQLATDDAADLADELSRSTDEEQRIYAVWLRTWFELEAPEPPEGELRLAALHARAQGGEELVKKLDAKIAALPPLQLRPPTST
jgi:hypothetical protein